MTDPLSAEARATYDALEAAIEAHFRQLWADSEQTGKVDFIPDWAVVIYYEDMGTDEPQQGGYSVETRTNMRAHSIKGLLDEGKSWVDDLVYSDDDDVD